jgi:hypothetical protein
MRDEEYEFFSDCREKKSTAASAFKRKTHCGKGGRVRFPSDNLTKKELQKMNGETKSYRMNEPIKWEDFRSMPDDIQVMYIKLLRQKFNVPDRKIAEMMGITQTPFGREMKRLGIATGKYTRARNTPWDKEGFYAWCGLVPLSKDGEEIIEEPAVGTEEIFETISEETAEEIPVENHFEECAVALPKRAIPMTGSMVFEGLAENVLETMRVLLGGANVHISITWDVLSEEVC